MLALMTEPLPVTSTMPDADRQAILAAAVAKAVRKGYRVESQGPFQAVVVKGKRPNHVLHLLLSVLTVSIWLLVWIFLAVVKHEKRKVISVDAYGNVSQ